MIKNKKYQARGRGGGGGTLGNGSVSKMIFLDLSLILISHIEEQDVVVLACHSRVGAADGQMSDFNGQPA